MTFQHEIWRDGDAIDVLVRADVYRDSGAPGSASYAPGWYCDITRVRLVGGADIEPTPEEESVMKDVAISICRE